MQSTLSRRDLLRLSGSAIAGAIAAPFLAACNTMSSVLAPTATDALAAFPPGFLWGTATSAYQIEGAVREDGRGPSIWDTFSHTPGTTVGGATGDVADDHYHRYQQDLDLMQQLGLQSYRFSIAWPRIFPTGTGTLNHKGLDFYKSLVDGLLQRNIRPVATLFHWDLPQALQDRGGWENRDSASWFADYAAAMFAALGDKIPLWLTLNEPKTVTQVGYIYGAHAPGIRDPQRAYTALHYMLMGHGKAVQAFRAARPANAQIGIALNLAPVYAAPGTTNNAYYVGLQDGFENRLYLDPVLRGHYPNDIIQALQKQGIDIHYIQSGDEALMGTPIDTLGVNYYNPVIIDDNGNHITAYPTTEATWEQVYPAGLTDLLTRLKRDYGDLPLAITENGRPSTDAQPGTTVDDLARIQFLYNHFQACARAITTGVRVTSYHVWSLLDNFEWNQGYSQRWGIVSVDYATQRRAPKQSALWYRQVIQHNAVQPVPGA